MYINKYIYVSIDNKYLILIYMYYIILSRKCLGWVYIDGGLFYIILKYWVEIFINRLMGIMSMFIYIILSIKWMIVVKIYGTIRRL